MRTALRKLGLGKHQLGQSWDWGWSARAAENPWGWRRIGGGSPRWGEANISLWNTRHPFMMPVSGTGLSFLCVVGQQGSVGHDPLCHGGIRDTIWLMVYSKDLLLSH